MSEKLKPCPFCGGTPAVFDYPGSAIHVRCKCGVQLWGGYSHFVSISAAVVTWNVRALLAQPNTCTKDERALRLEAERQVGELRRLIAERSALQQLCLKLLEQSKSNLNPAGRLAKEILKVLDTNHKLKRILNTTSTEGKDHE